MSAALLRWRYNRIQQVLKRAGHSETAASNDYDGAVVHLVGVSQHLNRADANKIAATAFVNEQQEVRTVR